MTATKGAKEQKGCPKSGCKALGWWMATNECEYGDTTVVESWEGWCPDHGGYGQSGSSGIVWDDEMEVTPPMTETEKARYYGFRSVEEFRRYTAAPFTGGNQ